MIINTKNSTQLKKERNWQRQSRGGFFSLPVFRSVMVLRNINQKKRSEKTLKSRLGPLKVILRTWIHCSTSPPMGQTVRRIFFSFLATSDGDACREKWQQLLYLHDTITEERYSYQNRSDRVQVTDFRVVWTDHITSHHTEGHNSTSQRINR